MLDTNVYDDINESLLVDDSFTVSYGFDKKSWVSMHDYVGSFYFATRNESFFSFYGRNIYIHNVGEYGRFYDGIIYPSYITPIFRPATITEDRHYAFILESINYICDFYKTPIDFEKKNLNKTFNTLSFHNSYQSSTAIPLVLIKDNCTLKEQWSQINVRRVRNSWFFNKIRDETNILNTISIVEKYDEIISNVIRVNCSRKHRLFVDDFVILKMTYDNSDGYTMQFSEVNFNVTIVKV